MVYHCSNLRDGLPLL